MPQLRRKFHFTSLTFISLAAFGTACGGGLHSGWKGSIFGKDKKNDDRPFVLDRTQLHGLYYISYVEGPNLSFSDVPLSDEANQMLLSFSDDKVSIFRPGATNKDCNGERTATATNSTTLTLAAKGSCAAEDLVFVSQGSVSFGLAKSMHFKDQDATKVYFIQGSVEGMRDGTAAWQAVPADFPPAFKDLVPGEAPQAAIDAARASFRASFAPGATFVLTTAVRDKVFVQDNQQATVILVKGRALDDHDIFDYWSDSASYCTLTASSSAPAFFDGGKAKITAITVAHPQRDKGTWTLDLSGKKVAETETANSTRDNHVIWHLQTADGVVLSCSKPRTADPMTLDEVKTALGTLGRFEK